MLITLSIFKYFSKNNSDDRNEYSIFIYSKIGFQCLMLTDYKKNPSKYITLSRGLTKTNKVTVWPAKIQISLGIMQTAVDAQADLSLCWAHTHFVGFVMLWLIFRI